LEFLLDLIGPEVSQLQIGLLLGHLSDNMCVQKQFGPIALPLERGNVYTLIIAAHAV
jgi:hypothetical protein